MGKIAIILRKPPYADINAAEAVRHALGGVSDDLEVSLVLVDGGVLLARKDHIDTGTGLTNLESALKDCIDMGVKVFVEDLSLKEQYIEQEGLIEGIKTVDGQEVAEILKETEKTMIF